MKETSTIDRTVTLTDGQITAEVKLGDSGAQALVFLGAAFGVRGVDQTIPAGDNGAYQVFGSSTAAAEAARVFARVAEMLAEHENALALKQASGAH